jgi:hypothetical protein
MHRAAAGWAVGCSFQRRSDRFPLRYLFRFEAEHLLARCGFKVEDIDADYDKSPFGSTYPGELILIARKPWAF